MRSTVADSARPSHDWCSPDFAAAFASLGITAANIFTHPAIKPWRTLPDRDNCTLDLPGNPPTRLHVKRYPVPHGNEIARAEIAGLRLLQSTAIPTTPLVAALAADDGTGFVITHDLVGHQPADKALAAGLPFDAISKPTAQLAAKLHDAKLHHRDLYLCHFFIADSLNLRLIDAARVRPLPGWPTRRRWIVKDLAQFWYSMQVAGITADARQRWLEHYAAARQLRADALRSAIERKAAWIARHDQQLRRAQPNRNISIPK